MRTALILLLLSALALGGCAQAPIRLYSGPVQDVAKLAVINLPEQLEVAQLNGTAVAAASGMGSKGDKLLELTPGRYELLVFYRELWAQGDSHEVLRSNPVRFDVEAQAGHRYRIDYARPPTFGAATALSQAFSGWLTDQTTGQRTDSRPSGLAFRGGLLAQMQGDQSLVLAEMREGGQQVVAPLVPANSPAVPVVPALPTDDQLLLVKAWWNQANPDQRRAFLEWVAAQR